MRERLDDLSFGAPIRPTGSAHGPGEHPRAVLAKPPGCVTVCVAEG